LRGFLPTDSCAARKTLLLAEWIRVAHPASLAALKTEGARPLADVPDTLVLRRHRDEPAQRTGIWVRRGVLAVFAGAAVAGLANVFGQRPESVQAGGAAAKLSVYAPSAIRGGDFMEARFHITARRDLKNAILRLDPGWGEGLSMNTIEPSPVGQASDNGRFSFTLGHIPKGRSFILFMEFQVNPTNLAWNRRQNVELDDGNRKLLVVHHSLTIFP